MKSTPEIQRAPLTKFYLDAKNPRLGRRQANADLSQEKILDLMRNWVLDELAISYLESGFWTHEALLVIEEEVDGKSGLIVVEGNRRLAALIYLRKAINGNPISKKWASLVENIDENKLEELNELFRHIPYIQIDSRQEVEAFLGFRHVTGIKQWPTEQKARYIARLIDEQGMSYEEIMRKIGSKTPTVRQHYISFRVLLQMENELEDFSLKDAEGRFSVMYLSLRTKGVRTYLHIDVSTMEPRVSQRPIPEIHLDALANFARWLFGTDEQDPLFTDSRRVDDFGKILESPEAVEYLENKRKPDFDYAFRLAGGEESDLVHLLSESISNVKYVLGRVHHYRDSEDIQEMAEVLGIDAHQLMSVFPNVLQRFQEREKEN